MNAVETKTRTTMEEFSHVRRGVAVVVELSDEGLGSVDFVSHCKKRTIEESALAPEQEGKNLTDQSIDRQNFSIFTLNKFFTRQFSILIDIISLKNLSKSVDFQPFI